MIHHGFMVQIETTQAFASDATRQKATIAEIWTQNTAEKGPLGDCHRCVISGGLAFAVALSRWESL